MASLHDGDCEFDATPSPYCLLSPFSVLLSSFFVLTDFPTLPLMQRRRFLGQLAAGATLGASLSPSVSPLRAASAPPPIRPRHRVLRVAHLTDPHVFGERGAEAGVAEALRHAQAAKPDFIFFGGDLIMDALGKEKDAAIAEFALWERVVAAELRTPHHVCLGNHDVWGWKLRDDAAAAAATDPLFGKGLALERLALRDRYYSFNQAGWHFIVLDSTQRVDDPAIGYTARLDEAQFEWLVRDLAATPAAVPICVLSHIPILSACAFLDGENEKTGNWQVPGQWMHLDVRRLKTLFRQHPNVKACLSGHIHLADEVSYLGVRYFCNGAVSGGWWKGPYQEFGPAYAIVDFHDDGTVDNRLVHYRQPPAVVGA